MDSLAPCLKVLHSHLIHLLQCPCTMYYQTPLKVSTCPAGDDCCLDFQRKVYLGWASKALLAIPCPKEACICRRLRAGSRSSYLHRPTQQMKLQAIYQGGGFTKSVSDSGSHGDLCKSLGLRQLTNLHGDGPQTTIIWVPISWFRFQYSNLG